VTLAPVDVRSQDGTLTGTVELDPELFAVQPNVPLMHQVVTAQLAAARAGTQSTKTRAEVSGGGAKPYRQKGTGRARQGSTSAPHYAGGGVALGPKPRSYRQRTPRKMVQLALRGALSDRAGGGQVAVVESWDWQIPSTKDAQAALGALGLSGRVLVVLSREDQLAYKSFRNLPGVDLVLVPELAAYDVLCSDWVVFTRRTLPGNNTWGEAPAGIPQAKVAAAPGAASAEPAETDDGVEAAATEASATEASATEASVTEASSAGASTTKAGAGEEASDLGPDDAEADELATQDMAELRSLDADDDDAGEVEAVEPGGPEPDEEEPDEEDID
jgi:large subunit ribosomal protein L4